MDPADWAGHEVKHAGYNLRKPVATEINSLHDFDIQNEQLTRDTHQQ